MINLMKKKGKSEVNLSSLPPKKEKNVILYSIFLFKEIFRFQFDCHIHKF